MIDPAHIRTICTRLQFAALAAIAAALLAAAPASADFGFSDIEVGFTDAEGNVEQEAGSHPFAMRTFFRVNTTLSAEKGVQVVDGALRDLQITLPRGFIGNPTAVPRCETLEFLTKEINSHPTCANSTAVGTLTAVVGGGTGNEGEETVAIYNMRPSPGVAAKLGFEVGGVAITLDVGVTPDPPYNVLATLSNTSQIVEVIQSETILWGTPADSAHDPERGRCAYPNVAGNCAAGIPARPFLTLPRTCEGPLRTSFRALSWWSGNPLNPGPPALFSEEALSPEMTGCSKLSLAASIDARPSTENADSPSGLDFDLDLSDEGIDNPKGTAHSDVEKIVATLPKGVTLNPSAAEGLATCSPQELERETLASEPGEGCPGASKIGTIEAETPILEDKTLKGALFVATQDDPRTPQPGAENPFDSLLAQYIVIRDRELGVIVKQAGKLEPDPLTGQLRATFADIPPVPLSHVRLHLREGGRSPLVSPPDCGAHLTEALLTPSGDPTASLPLSSSFQIARGVGGGPCPPAGTPPFAPGFSAGTLNNDAGSYSSTHIRFTRRDGDQDLTRFDAVLPRGLLAKLAGVAQCPEAAIAAAKARRGRDELASPSCPAASEIGKIVAGAGVGSQLTYVPGKLYLAGPFGGAPLSVVGVVPAVAGPFDVGTVVVRQALQVNPKTGEVTVDGAHSDPFPHILAGIPLRVRDVRADVDRPNFTINPTSCDPFATTGRLWGGGADQFSTADDAPVAIEARFQAANCARLGFKPRLQITLKGGAVRGDHPALQGIYRPRAGDANLSDLSTRLPRSAFLDQGHIRTICTRVQFAAKACPKGAIYGHVTAYSPLLEEPLKGPAYLRSSNHNLPDLVLALHGLVDIEASARIDSIKGGIRARFENAPDAPLTKVVLNMAGGAKGLIVNSRGLCRQASRASVELIAQSNKRLALHPEVRAAGCGKQGGHRRM